MTHSVGAGRSTAALIAVFVFGIAGACRLAPASRPLDRKTASKLIRDVTVDTPWIMIPSGLPDAPARDAQAERAYRKLAGAGMLQCDDDLSECVVGPQGRDLTNAGALGIRVTIGLLVADSVSVMRLVDQNAASAGATVRFQPSAVFAGFRPELLAILKAHGDEFAADQIAGGHMARALFHRSGNGWHLENIELLERTGAASRRSAAPDTGLPGGIQNLATSAKVSVSSEDTSAGGAGILAVDGLVDAASTDASAEWFTRGEREGAWIRLTWNAPVRVREVVLHDRPSLTNHVQGGVLLFSDGSQESVGALPNDGSPLRVEFDPKVIGWLEFRVTSAVGSNAGLAEIEVLGAPAAESDLMQD